MIDRMLERIIDEHEKGYVDHPADRGGATNHGITQATLSKWRGGRPVSKNDVRALTKAEAIEIYRRMYVLEPRFDRLPSWMQYQTVDWGINAGQVRAWSTIQLTYNSIFPGTPPLVIDGKAGPKTWAAVNEAGECFEMHRLGQNLWNAVFAAHRLNRYLEIIGTNPSQAVFAKGWGRRGIEVLQECL